MITQCQSCYWNKSCKQSNSIVHVGFHAFNKRLGWQVFPVTMVEVIVPLFFPTNRFTLWSWLSLTSTNTPDIALPSEIESGSIHWEIMTVHYSEWHYVPPTIHLVWRQVWFNCDIFLPSGVQGKLNSFSWQWMMPYITVYCTLLVIIVAWQQGFKCVDIIYTIYVETSLWLSIAICQILANLVRWCILKLKLRMAGNHGSYLSNS